jgi:hypothetical protein
VSSRLSTRPPALSFIVVPLEPQQCARWAVVVRYRGYLIRESVGTVSNSAWIARPDGTWRYSPPTVVDVDEWQVLKEREPGQYERAGVATSEQDARELVDALIAGLAEPGAAPNRGGR